MCVTNTTNRDRATAVIKEDDKFLLIHRIKPDNDYYVFPGGGVEKGETIEGAFKREVYEEVGLDVTDFEPLFVIQNLSVPTWATIHKGLLRSCEAILL